MKPSSVVRTILMENNVTTKYVVHIAGNEKTNGSKTLLKMTVNQPVFAIKGQSKMTSENRWLFSTCHH